MGVATLLKSTGVKSHQNELMWVGIPKQTVQTSLDHASQTQPSILVAQSASNPLEAEERPRSSVLEDIDTDDSEEKSEDGEEVKITRSRVETLRRVTSIRMTMLRMKRITRKRVVRLLLVQSLRRKRRR